MTKPHISLEIVKAAARLADNEGRLGYQNNVSGCAYSSAALDGEDPGGEDDIPCAVAAALPPALIAEIVERECNSMQWLHLVHKDFVANHITWNPEEATAVQAIQDSHDGLTGLVPEALALRVKDFHKLIGKPTT